MKGILFFIFFPIFSDAQIITSIAGGGTVLGDGGSATSAYINNPCGIRFNKQGHLYIASGSANRIRKIDTFGVITTIAGIGSSGYTGDGGPATAARINFPTGLAFDTSGNIIFADALNHAIRKIDIATGIISTICGNGTMGYSGDNGPATAALIEGPQSVFCDKFNNVYIPDNYHVVRKINGASGIITTIAGTGIAGYSGDGIPGTSAQLYFPTDVIVDDTGNIYIADQGNYRIRKINTIGIITTIAGNGGTTYTGHGLPATNAQLTPTCIQFDSAQVLYVSSDHRISKIDHAGTFHTVAGTGAATNTGDGGPATAATLYEPTFMVFDECNNLYTSVINFNRIRKITFDTACNPHNNPTLRLSIPGVVDGEIYPNPVHDELVVNSTSGIACITISNPLGQVVYTHVCKSQKEELNISVLSAGVYFVNIISDTGERTVKRIIKR